MARADSTWSGSDGSLASVAASGQSGRFRRQLVQALRRDGCIRSSRVRDAFLEVPRELFVVEFAEREGLAAVYRDESILTKRNPHGVPLSSSSQPAIMALMLEQLQVEAGMKVLEVGAGTGYNAALLSLLVGSRGRVVSVDVDPEIASDARRALRAAGYKARVVVGDGRQGYADAAPYDRIIVTASSDSVPVAWFQQLNPGGLLEAPLRLSASGAQAIPLLRKERTGFRSTTVITGGFMPLRAAGEDAAAALRRPALVVSDRTGESPMPIHELYGVSTRTLSARAKRRLLSISLEEGRQRPLGLRANSSALTLFLSLRLPARNLITTEPRFGIGVITRDGTSLALLEPSFAGHRPTISSLRAFGDKDAEDMLLPYVREWDRRGRPGESDLAITASYLNGRGAQLKWGWPAIHA
jgi:protein-L-isoaspartate(D-aspartate) O-methyltransferase